MENSVSTKVVQIWRVYDVRAMWNEENVDGEKREQRFRYMDRTRENRVIYKRGK